MLLIMSMMMSINIMLVFINHPLSMGLILISQTIMTSIMTGTVIKTFWLSYILLITILSGALVLFIYMSSIASNEKFQNKPALWAVLITTMMIGVSSLFLSGKMIIKNNYLGMEMNMATIELTYLNKMFNSESMYIILLLVCYLLFTMIAATYLVNIFEGPMRMKM